MFAQEKKATIRITEKNIPLSFPIVENGKSSSVYIDEKDAEVVGIAAEAFKNDIYLLTNVTPKIFKNTPVLSTYPIIVGTIGKSYYIDQLIKTGKINKNTLVGKWETFSISVVENPAKGVKRALIIAGSDRRGTAFGVFELSRMLGVSPLNWWADVKPAHKNALYVTTGQSLIGPPSVKYRGIFINDEDWGIQPWAAKNMDTDVKDMGPKTYAKIFELLLRLKANYIWPAMHPSTKAFFYYKENPKVADKYAIVLGGSHCEPMLRNNVFEWAENFEHEYGKKPGEWRYDLNKNEMATYWTDRVLEAKNYEAVYTVGMRGIHDGSMPGPKDKNEKVRLLGEVIKDQRLMLDATNLTQPVNTIPQIFCPYKEVLSLYQAGLDLPDDVTIVWADDNHGYIRQLSNAQEQKRAGGSGVYYHISYWGAPHDYLWLSSISPSLISYELTKAYQYKADRLWVINVGDIKPAEMETQFAMDLAWDVNKWRPENAHNYAESWAAETFGQEFAKPIAEIKAIYYRLAHEAKPEHMGSVSFTDQQANERLAAYAAIYKNAVALNEKIPPRLKDAYFELILYPVQGAYLMNQKILYAKKSFLYADRGDKQGLVYAQKAKDAFEEIKTITVKYNKEIAGGKWDGIMDYRPRKLPVFDMPKVATSIAETVKNEVKSENKQVISATTFVQRFAPKGTMLQTIKGLGVSGKGISVFPLNFVPTKDNEFEKAAFLTYNVNFKTTGEHQIEVKCLPTQRVSATGKVRYAIGVGNEKPQIINISPAAENDIWKKNVLQGFASGITKHQITKVGNSVVKIYLLDPGIVINQLEIQ
ncbi:glycosyl hydrolase 115 family protein [Pedobacter polaris]|uniref:glycosyl hydrolase 115 family protein n=1 Tax=Pedobacter polaris TaxID=2571273 RepID=UPI00197F0F84|nr:glycosyl hydrolase 115 family protein [Pedobacter polaris]